MDRTEPPQLPIVFKHNRRERAPKKLFEICLNCVFRNLNLVCEKTPDGFILHEGLALPSGICEALIEKYQSVYGFESRVARLFEDVTRTNLGTVDLHHSAITDDGLEHLLRHGLQELKLRHCNSLTPKTYANVFRNAGNLRSLTIGPRVLHPDDGSSNSIPSPDDMPAGIDARAPNLRSLVLQSFVQSPHGEVDAFLDTTVARLSQLSVLDLSFCTGVGDLRCLRGLDNLHTLVLFDVPHLQGAISNICTLRSLVVLDISSGISPTETYPGRGIYENPNKTLGRLVECLPHLQALDISGTNLAGKSPAEPSKYESSSGKKSDIAGLECRIDNPLEFLGLYRTMHNACRRHDIPAKIVSGDANEKQIFNAAASWMVKPKFIKYIFDDINDLLERDECTQIGQALDIVIEALLRYIDELEVLVGGITILLAIVNYGEHSLLKNDSTAYNHIMYALISLMYYYHSNRIILPNLMNCLILFSLGIPEVLTFQCFELVHILVLILTIRDHDMDVYRIAFYVLYKIACKMNNKQKDELGKSGVIMEIMAIMKDRLNQKLYDNVLEWSWITLRCLTRGAAKNSSQFLSENGMIYFLQCLKIFPNEYELLLHMVGLVENVAAIKPLRPRLMHVNIINTLLNILSSTQDFLQINCIVAGIIAFLASDGIEAWTIETPRHEALDHLTKAILNWNLDNNANMPYNYLDKILALAQVRHTPQCALWAVWNLANFTKRHFGKYRQLVIDGGGLQMMKDLLMEHQEFKDADNLLETIQSLAQTVISQCLEHNP